MAATLDGGDAPMRGRVVEADFEKDTLTFVMAGSYYAKAGLFHIIPADWQPRFDPDGKPYMFVCPRDVEQGK